MTKTKASVFLSTEDLGNLLLQIITRAENREWTFPMTLTWVGANRIVRIFDIKKMSTEEARIEERLVAGNEKAVGTPIYSMLVDSNGHYCQNVINPDPSAKFTLN